MSNNEGQHLVHPKTETADGILPVYGTVNSVCEDVAPLPQRAKSSDLELRTNGGSQRPDVTTANTPTMTASLRKCGETVCGQKKLDIRFEPWSRNKTIAMVVILILLASWMIVMASLKDKI